MADVATLSDITAAQAAAQQAVVTSLVTAAVPGAEVRRGPFHDLVLYASGALAAVNQANIARVQQSTTVAGVAANPALATTAAVDALASNWRVTRLPARAAAGAVLLRFSAAQAALAAAIPAGASFVSAAGAEFQVAGAVVVSPTPSAAQRQLVPLGDGTFAATVPVTAAVPGAAGNVPNGTVLASRVVIANLTAAYAAGDFAGGADAETNAGVIARLPAAGAEQSLATRAGVEAAVRATPGYAGVVGVSAVGAGDAEQLRYHTALPVASGGRVDAYVRPTALPLAETLFKVATLVATAGGFGTWQVGLGRDESPGFYEVTKVTRPNGTGNYVVTSDVRTADLTAGTTPSTRAAAVPDIGNGAALAGVEAAYTRYQAAVVQFKDTDTAAAGLTVGVSTATYAVTLARAPGLVDVQDALSAPATRPAAGDCLVKAAVPCFTTVALGVTAPAGASVPAAGVLLAAAATAVNARAFPGAVLGSTVKAAVEPLLPPGGYVSSVVLTGRVRQPTGVNLAVGPAADLLAPAVPATMTTAKTVSFYLDPLASIVMYTYV